MTVRVLTYGTFDLLHVGHLNLLTRAAQYGDLHVFVSTDDFNESKGKKTVVPFQDRLAMVRALRCVWSVSAENSWSQKEDDVEDAFISTGQQVTVVMGDDWKGKFDNLQRAGYCQVVYLPRTPDVSTSYLKQSIRESSR